MQGINTVTLVGTLSNDPELHYASSGTPFLKFNVATSEVRWNKENEQKQVNTAYHPIVTYGRTAEDLHRILRKGYLVGIIGSIRNAKGAFEVLARRVQVFEQMSEA